MKPVHIFLLPTLLLIATSSFFLTRKNEAPQKEQAQYLSTTSAPTEALTQVHKEVIGTSVQGRPILAYTYGIGETHIVFVGGMHGGYEWNSVALAYAFLEHLETAQDMLTSNLTITVIPSVNPDGLYVSTGKEGIVTSSDKPKTVAEAELGRFNAHGVDLNRNFDCKWQEKSTWRTKVVDAGDRPFSEPETQAIRDFALSHTPDAFVFWHSKANAVFASECENGILPETRTLMNTYAKASSYTPKATFSDYEVTGDAEGWLASISIPAITVELETHDNIEWEANKAGIEAILAYLQTKNN